MTMPFQTQTLRPGLLVSLKTSVTGNVRYQTREIEGQHIESDGTARSVWETQKTILDPTEQERAIKVRSRCRTLVTSVCAQSSFGMLCRESDASKLMDAVTEAQGLARDFNRDAKATKVAVYVVVGKIAADDAQAVRAINSEVRGLLADMQEGLQTLNVETVRAAADKARSIGKMLSPSANEAVKQAVDAARAVARRIVKSGEEAAGEIDNVVLGALQRARTQFLDLDDEEAGEVAAPVAIARGGLDLMPDEDTTPIAVAAPAMPLFEMTAD